MIALALFGQMPVFADDLLDLGTAVESNREEALTATSATQDMSAGSVRVPSSGAGAPATRSVSTASIGVSPAAASASEAGVDNNIHAGRIVQTTLNPMTQATTNPMVQSMMPPATNPLVQSMMPPATNPVVPPATNPMMPPMLQPLHSGYSPSGMPVNSMGNSGFYNNTVAPNAGMYQQPGMFCQYGNMSPHANICQHANMCQHPVICGGATMCNGNQMMMTPMQCNGMHGNTQMQSSNNGQINTQMVGAIGTAVMLGSFLQNGGIGGMLRSVGWDNRRYIRGPMAGY